MLTGLVLAPVLLGTLACGPTDQPAPKKLERNSPFDRQNKPEPDPNSPFRNPATQVPAGRDGDQQSDEAIEATLAKAAEYAASKDTAQERNALRDCANKTPASARCDGRMGLSLITSKNRRATALYYLREAAMLDDPKADASLYAEVAEALRAFGNTDHALMAMDKAVARNPTAEHLFAYGRLLSTTDDRLLEGADKMAEARAQDDRIEWLYEEAVIRGQIPVREQAVLAHTLLGQYVERAADAPADSLPAAPDTLKGRIAELASVAKTYPTQAEFDKQQSDGPKPATPGPQ